jgi:DNA-binding transcriptional regulator YiaG
MKNEINVRKLREDLGMTQAQLAAEVGVDQSTVSLWETTETKPRGPALKLLAMIEARKPRRSAEVA